MRAIHWARATLLVGLLAAGVAFWDTPLVYPLKLLAVMGHETGHGVAALLVGGAVERVSLSADESGQCLSRIPDGFWAKTVVYSAGYVGSAVIAALLLLLTYRLDARRWMLGAACVWLVAMGLFYARDLFTFAFCATMAALFGAGARWLPSGAAGAVNAFVAAFTALYAVADLKDDLWTRTVRSHSDAQLLADLTGVPAILWAAAWTVVSAAVLFAGVAVVLREPSGAAARAGRRRSRGAPGA